ncbi:MAG: Fe-S cluster assembly protein SufD [Luteibacter sp.]|uniref:Fe-S cluster assembly protein SufD n=1 Tax=Luteibacter sp. TaxID=1886636 RepID=UPI00280839A5|nr:Fe-S cluster assembly protein SufD [Luteibacter sp.]MDQ7997753.1 Fe-S cluster assembly protein SufD [Luteibacter sp.]MDQ8050953.1 Fe-S cluster assembly protein SufD [Luteibacter sp.]
MTQAPSPFVRAALDAASALPESGIAWLDAARRDNLQAFAEAGLPEGRNEAWKYTPLRALSQRAFAVADAAVARDVAIDAASFALPGVDSARIVFVDGVFRADLSALDRVDGVSLAPLAAALKEQPEPLRFALASRHRRGAADAFAHLNAAFATDGVVLRIADGIDVAKPLHIVHVFSGVQPDTAWHVRVLVEAGQGSRADIVEQFVSMGEANQLGTVVADYVVRENARLGVVLLQAASTATTLVRRGHVRLDANASATVHALEVGGALVRHELTAELAGDHARFDSRGVFALDGRQHIDTQLEVRHNARDTASDALWRGIANGRSRGVFRGAIVVAEGADGSDASLSNKNLLLSGSAEIDTKPELEIYADEVKAAHGATIGQLDERSLFYLRSRGIPLAQARSLLTLAFCRAALESLPNEALREHLGDLLVAHLPTGPSAG